jgi:hypothetical protein
MVKDQPPDTIHTDEAMGSRAGAEAGATAAADGLMSWPESSGSSSHRPRPLSILGYGSLNLGPVVSLASASTSSAPAAGQLAAIEDYPSSGSVSYDHDVSPPIGGLLPHRDPRGADNPGSSQSHETEDDKDPGVSVSQNGGSTRSTETEVRTRHSSSPHSSILHSPPQRLSSPAPTPPPTSGTPAPIVDESTAMEKKLLAERAKEVWSSVPPKSDVELGVKARGGQEQDDRRALLSLPPPMPFLMSVEGLKVGVPLRKATS